MQSTKKQKSVVREWLEAIIGSLILTAFIITFIAQSFSVQGTSMMPTLWNSQRLLVDKISYRFIEPSPGEIIVFKFPVNQRDEFIKRVIGVPGDTVAIIDGNVFINQELIKEEYISEPAMRDFYPQVVPEDHYFVLGDNRNNSLDSRDMRVSFVPKELVVGRAVWSYWPLSRIEIVRPPAIFAQK